MNEEVCAQINNNAHASFFLAGTLTRATTESRHRFSLIEKKKRPFDDSVSLINDNGFILLTHSDHHAQNQHKLLEQCRKM